MIDLIKFVTRVDLSEFESNPLLDFEQFQSIKTGLVRNYKEAKYKGFKFRLYDTGLIIVSGSIHKYANFQNEIIAPNQISMLDIQRGFNGNDLNYIDLKYHLQDFANNFNFDLTQCMIQNIEIGLNITHSFDTEQILNGLIFHKGALFNRPLENSFRIAVHQRYQFKIYDKGLQYGLKEPTIRIELRYKKMTDLNALNFYTLNDLFNEAKIRTLHENLLLEFEKVLLYDYTIDAEKLNFTEVNRIKDYSNPNFWLKTKSNHRDRHKKSLKKLIEHYSEDVQTNILGQMQAMYITLISPKKSRVRFNRWDKRLLITQC